MACLPLGIFRVKEDSMLPALKDGNYVLVSKWTYILRKPNVGDIIVLKHPKKNMRIIKRIKKINADGTIFVTGDNEKVSEDSRRFGPVYARSIIGKVIFVL